MATGIVDRLYEDFSSLREFLADNKGVQLLPTIEENFPKTMLLAAASHFEQRLSRTVEELVIGETEEGHVLVWLVKNKAISRQYHTWFDWDARNANRFFRMFGRDFGRRAAEWVDADPELGRSVSDFLEIGRERNRLIHMDFAGEKTALEVYELYKSAGAFVEWVPVAIQRHLDEDSEGRRVPER